MEQSELWVEPGLDLSLDRTIKCKEHFWVNWGKLKKIFFLLKNWRLLTERNRFENNMHDTITLGLKWIKKYIFSWKNRSYNKVKIVSLWVG